CSFLAEDDEVTDLITRIVSPTEGRDPRARAQLVLLSLLWTRSYARRPETLRTTNRFVANQALTERTLLSDVLPAGPPSVDVDDEDWRAKLAAALQTRGASRLVSTSGTTPTLAQAVRELMVDPLEVNWLHVHPQLEGITREGGRYSVSLSLRE